MAIKAGDRMPSGTLKTMTKDLKTDDLFKGKKVVLFSVPGAFTPTCDAKHLPGFVQLADQIRAKGIDTIACMAVNDVFVMNAWGKSSAVGDKVLMLADGNGEYAKTLGLELDAKANELCRPDADVARRDSRGRILVIASREDETMLQEIVHVLANTSGNQPLKSVNSLK